MRIEWKVVIGALSLAIVLWLFTGCLALDPGGNVARGLRQENIYQWGETGNFNAELVGSHESGFTMYEGFLVFKVDENGEVMVDDEGNPVIDPTKSNITAYLKTNDKADIAGQALAVAFTESTKQMAALGQLTKDIATMAFEAMNPVGSVGGGADAAPPTVGEIIDVLRPPLAP